MPTLDTGAGERTAAKAACRRSYSNLIARGVTMTICETPRRYAVSATLTSVACRFGIPVLRRFRVLRAMSLATPALIIVTTLTGAAATEAKHSQCWVCVQRLTMELPAVNPQKDATYE